MFKNLQLRFLSAFLLLLCGVGSSWGQEVKTWNWTAAATDIANLSKTPVTLNGKDWTFTQSGEYINNSLQSSCIQIGKSGEANNVTLSTSAFVGKVIKEISVECSSYQGKHTLKMEVGPTEVKAATATASWTTVNSMSTGAIAVTAGDIVLTFTAGTNARAMYIKSITVKYTENSSDPTISPESETFDFGKITKLTTESTVKDFGFIYSNLKSDPEVDHTNKTDFKVESQVEGGVGLITITLLATEDNTYEDNIKISDGTTEVIVPVTAKISIFDGEDFMQVTDVAELKEGCKVIFVGNNVSANKWLAGTSTLSSARLAATELDANPDGFLSQTEEMGVFTLIKNGDKWNFVDSEGKYLQAPSTTKNTVTLDAYSEDYADATIAMNADNEGEIVIEFAAGVTNGNKNPQDCKIFTFNSQASAFACYGSRQAATYLYYAPAPTETVTVSDGISSFCSHNVLDFTDVEDITAYIATDVNGTSVKLAKVEGKVEANTGLLLVGKSGDTNVPVAVNGTDYSTTNLLKPAFNGSSIPCSDSNYDRYVFGTKNGVKAFYHLINNPMTSGGNYAYLEVSAASEAPSRYTFVIDDEATGIDGVQGVEGRVLNETYNLAGQKVSSNFRGIVIKNGKKVVVK